jgi:hypothetical protein
LNPLCSDTFPLLFLNNPVHLALQSIKKTRQSVVWLWSPYNLFYLAPRFG